MRKNIRVMIVFAYLATGLLGGSFAGFLAGNSLSQTKTVALKTKTVSVVPKTGASAPVTKDPGALAAAFGTPRSTFEGAKLSASLKGYGCELWTMSGSDAAGKPRTWVIFSCLK